MHKAMSLLRWMAKGLAFFVVFAFALNNQHEAVAHFFFGQQWRAPQIVLLLLAFSIGWIVGVAGMLPRWWRGSRRRPQVAGQAGKGVT